MAIVTEKQAMNLTRERLVSDQSARELAPLLTANERALVSILATAETYQLDIKPLLLAYAEETGSAAVKALAGQIAPGVHPLDAAREVAGVLTRPCEVALNSARASGSLLPFYRSWLAQTVDDRVNWIRHENTNVALVGRLGIKLGVCIVVLIFLVRKIMPEHQKMLEELGLEFNATARLMLSIADYSVKLFPLFLLVSAGIFLYIICFRRSIFHNYLRRWVPGRWRQIVLPKAVLRRKLMAWDLLAFRGSGDRPDTDWDGLVASGELVSDEAGIMKKTTGLETQAWLLRNMADRTHESRKSRFTLTVQLCGLLFQAALGFIIVLATITIFSMMIDVMNSLAVQM